MDKGGSVGDKDNRIDLGYVMEGEVTGSPMGFTMGGEKKSVLLAFFLDFLVGK